MGYGAAVDMTIYTESSCDIEISRFDENKSRKQRKTRNLADGEAYVNRTERENGYCDWPTKICVCGYLRQGSFRSRVCRAGVVLPPGLSIRY